MRIATAQWTIEKPASFAAWRERLRAALAEARESGAVLAVLPEYLALELAGVFPAAVHADLTASRRRRPRLRCLRSATRSPWRPRIC